MSPSSIEQRRSSNLGFVVHQTQKQKVGKNGKAMTEREAATKVQSWFRMRARRLQLRLAEAEEREVVLRELVAGAGGAAQDTTLRWY